MGAALSKYKKEYAVYIRDRPVTYISSQASANLGFKLN